MLDDTIQESEEIEKDPVVIERYGVKQISQPRNFLNLVPFEVVDWDKLLVKVGRNQRFGLKVWQKALQHTRTVVHTFKNHIIDIAIYASLALLWHITDDEQFTMFKVFDERVDQHFLARNAEDPLHL